AVAGAEVPLVDAVALDQVAQGADVQQRQRQVGGELEVLVVAGEQVVGQLEGHQVARAQFAGSRRGAAVDLDDVDVHLAGGDAAAGAGAVALDAAEVDHVFEYGGGDGGVVAEAVAFVDLALRVAGGVGLVD